MLWEYKSSFNYCLLVVLPHESTVKSAQLLNNQPFSKVKPEGIRRVIKGDSQITAHWKLLFILIK